MTVAMPDRRPATEEISGVIEHVTFHNEDSGFCVLRIKTKGHRGRKTVIGSAPTYRRGMACCGGMLGQGSGTGTAIQSQHHEDGAAHHHRWIERYLGSGLVKGIGPILAKKLVGRFGAEVLVVIEKRPPNCKPSMALAQASGANRPCMAGSKASPGDHAVPA